MKHTPEKENKELIAQVEMLLTTLDHISTYVFTKDLQGRYTFVSPNTQALFGYPTEEIIGYNDSKFFSLDKSNELTINDQIVMQEGRRLSKEERNVIAQTGETRYYATLKEPLLNNNGSVIGLFGVSRDITDHKKLEQRENARNKILELLTKNTPLTTILQEIVKLIEQEKSSTLCSILLLDIEKKHLITGAAPSLPNFYNEAINGVEIGPTVGSCGTAAYTHQRIIVEDIQTHPFWLPYKELASKANLSSCWSQPIFGTNDILGTFAIYQHNISTPDSSDIELIEFASQLAALAIERHKSTERLQLAARVFNETKETIVITDANMLITDTNSAFYETTGYRLEEVIGQNPKILSSGKQAPEFYSSMWQTITQFGHWQGEVWNRKKNGELYATLLNISELQNEQGDTINFVGISTDITQNKRQQEKLSQMAHFDLLTGLPNRALFSDRFQQSIAHSKRTQQLLAICFLDLDNFKPINDNFGHEVGDQLLIEVAKRMTGCMREEDTVSRQGGDEFTLLLNDIESYAQCKLTVERILETLVQPYLIKELSHTITASMGITLYPDDNEDIDTLIRHADNAMYQAKQAGKNRYFIFDSQYDRQLIEKHLRLTEVQQGLNKHEFSLYYQPKVNMLTGEVLGAEALIRWQHPQKGLIPPLDFLPLIDGTPLEIQLGEWVLEQALKQLDSWLNQDIKLQVSINIASHYLQTPSFLATLEKTITKYSAVDTKYLQLEILESSALGDLQTISRIIKTCQEALGVSIALDDFGTGYSSLTHLRSLSADTIKIDQSFIRDILDDPDDYTIIDGVISLSKAFNRDVIAEGVESTAHGRLLLLMGCEKAQGYGIARPMPAANIPNWLSEYRPNKEWLIHRDKVFSPLEKRKQELIITSTQWKKRFLTAINAEPGQGARWPILNTNQCHCGTWLKLATKEQLFKEHDLLSLGSAHDEFHAIAQKLYSSYQEGNINEARKGLNKFQHSFNHIIKALESTSLQP